MFLKRFYKLYVKKIGYKYLRNDYLNPQKKFRFLSQVLVKIVTLKITNFEGMDNLKYMLIPLVPNCAVQWRSKWHTLAISLAPYPDFSSAPDSASSSVTYRQV